MPRTAVSPLVRGLIRPDRTAAASPSRPIGPAGRAASSLARRLSARCARETERRAALLSAEDQVVQSMPDASPTKWHRAHVTWFFEQFLLRPFAPGYRPFDERFGYLLQFLLRVAPGRGRRARSAA